MGQKRGLSTSAGLCRQERGPGSRGHGGQSFLCRKEPHVVHHTQGATLGTTPDEE